MRFLARPRPCMPLLAALLDRGFRLCSVCAHPSPTARALYKTLLKGTSKCNEKTMSESAYNACLDPKYANAKDAPITAPGQIHQSE